MGDQSGTSYGIKGFNYRQKDSVGSFRREVIKRNVTCEPEQQQLKNLNGASQWCWGTGRVKAVFR